MQKWIRTALGTLIVGLCMILPSLTYASAIFNIVPNTTEITITSTGTITYTVSNTTQKSVIQNITIEPAYNISGNPLGRMIQNNGCAGISLGVGASCTFQISLTKNADQLTSILLMPRVCGYFGAVCTVPIESNRVRVNVSTAPTIPILTSLTITPNNSTILVGDTQQFTATGTYLDGSTQDLTALVVWASSNTSKATIDSSGLATGVGVGSSSVTASLDAVVGSTTLTMKKIMAYIANCDNSVTNTISICPVIGGGSRLGTCQPYSNSTFNMPSDIVLNNTATFAYVANTGVPSISFCPVNPDGSISSCQDITDGVNFDFTGLELNAANTLLYYTNYYGNRVGVCQVNSNGSLSNCSMLSTVFTGPAGRIALNGQGSLSYTAQYHSDTVRICPVKQDGSFDVCSTPHSDPAFVELSGIEIDPTSTYLYLTDAQSTVAICPINPDGSLQTCSVSNGNNTFDFSSARTTNMFIGNFTGVSYAYVPNEGPTPGTISICPVQQNGSLGTCINPSDPTLYSPKGIWVTSVSQ